MPLDADFLKDFYPGNSPEDEAEYKQLRADSSALAALRAEYQWIVCCQEMPDEELKQLIEAGPFQAPMEDYDEESRAHYLKRYQQALIVYESRSRVGAMKGLMTIKEIANDTGIEHSTILKQAQNGRFKGRTYQSGSTWLIDTSDVSYREWLEKHMTKKEK